MDSRYKTIYIHVTPIGKGLKWKSSVNGDQLARDVQAAIEEMENNGFDLMSSTQIFSTTSMGINATDGVMLVFKKMV